MGKLILFVGILLVIVGLLLIYAPGLLSWFGKLPGDIYIKNDNSHLYIPITSMVLVSIVLTIIINLFFKR